MTSALGASNALMHASWPQSPSVAGSAAANGGARTGSARVPMGVLQGVLQHSKAGPVSTHDRHSTIEVGFRIGPLPTQDRHSTIEVGPWMIPVSEMMIGAARLG